MKTKLVLTVFVLLFIIHHSAFAQGALTPPGAPVPTMRSLAQIEPRTPISSVPFTISVSGSYYLTTNVTISAGDAITIAANNVTLDLNGFTIASTRATATTDSAILLSGGRTGVAIYNGNISSGVTNSATGVFGGGGFSYGIYNSGFFYNVRVKSVSVAGVLNYGIYLGQGNSTVVEACSVNVAGTYGVYADSVSDSTAVNCGNYGVFAHAAHNCTGYGVGSGIGLFANTANNCFGYSAGSGAGLSASIANNCYGYSSGNGNGLSAGSVATGCYGYSVNGTGLFAFLASACHGESISGTSLVTSHNVNSF